MALSIMTGGKIGRHRRILSFTAALIFCTALVLSGWPGGARTVSAATVVYPTGTSWTVPLDWNNYHNTIEVIGGGGGGDINKTNGSPGSRYGGGGGGGGAYSISTDVSLTAGNPVTVQVGAGAGPTGAGGDTYVCNTNSGCSSITSGSVVVGAKGGGGANQSTAGGGGQASASVGTAVNGGDGGAGGTGGKTTCGGGGGAGGPNGAGNGGDTGAGGSDGAGGSADAGSGGGGGGAGSGGSAGGSGAEWDSTHGSGGGGGGTSSSSVGWAGGDYGGGGGGGRNTGGSGQQGLIIATYTPQPAYTLSNYRWYADSASQDVTDPWPSGAAFDLAQNTALTAIPAASGPPTSSQTLRLRLNITVSTNPLPANFEYFKLQYQSNASGSISCSTSSGWTDVNTGSGIWRFATNSVTDGTPLTTSRLSPVSNVLEVYAKSNPTHLNPNGVSAGQTMEYDFNIQDNGAADNTPYLFRVVMSDSTGSLSLAFGTYSVCPALNTAPATSDLMRNGKFFQNGVKQGDFWAN